MQGRAGQFDGAPTLLAQIEIAYQHVESELRAALEQASGNA